MWKTAKWTELESSAGRIYKGLREICTSLSFCLPIPKCSKNHQDNRTPSKVLINADQKKKKRDLICALTQSIAMSNYKTRGHKGGIHRSTGSGTYFIWEKTRCLWLSEVRQEYFQAPQLGFKHIKGTGKDHKHTSNLLAAWKYTKQLKKPSTSTNNSLAPEHRTLQANLGNDNINLHKALNWINPCTEISSVKTSLDISTPTLL